MGQVSKFLAGDGFFYLLYIGGDRVPFTTLLLLCSCNIYSPNRGHFEEIEAFAVCLILCVFSIFPGKVPSMAFLLNPSLCLFGVLYAPPSKGNCFVVNSPVQLFLCCFVFACLFLFRFHSCMYGLG